MKPSDLKIIRFEFIEVIVPAKPKSIAEENNSKPLHMLPVASKGKSSWSIQFDELPKLILKLHLNNGIIGIGEFYRDHNWQVIRSIAQNLLGKSLNDLSLRHLPIGLYREHNGFECAIWDAYAKAKEMRLVDLLGGPFSEKIKVGAWSSHRHAGKIGKVAANYQSQGYDCIKLKSDLEDDIVAICDDIKKEAPGMDVIIDPNQRWENYGEIRVIAKQLEEVGNVFCLEDPMPFWMMQDYHDLRNFTSIRIARHVSLPYIYQGQRSHDAINFLTHQACDGFNFNGGLAGFDQLAQIATAANLYFWHGSEVDLGILEAMYLHSCAATSHARWPSDIFGRMIRSHDLLKEPLEIKASFASLPKGFGLGVELDESALEKFQTHVETIQ